MSRAPSRRKCRCCKKFFVPDPRTTDRQRYCSHPACRLASKTASQRRWLSQEGNGDYFRGAQAVARVQRWRQEHPGYWRSKNPSTEQAQPIDRQSSTPDQSSCNVPSGLPGTLQDDWVSRSPAFIGLLSMVTGATLQEEIAHTTRQLDLRGRNILGGTSPGTTPTLLPT